MNKITKSYVLAIILEAAAAVLIFREFIFFSSFETFRKGPSLKVFILYLVFCIGLAALSILRRPRFLGVAGSLAIAAVSVYSLWQLFKIVASNSIVWSTPNGANIDPYFEIMFVDIEIIIVAGILLTALILIICATKKLPQGAVLVIFSLVFILFLNLRIFDMAHDKLNQTFSLIDILKALRENNTIHAPGQVSAYAKASLCLCIPPLSLIQLTGIMFGISDISADILSQPRSKFDANMKKFYGRSLFAKESGFPFEEVFEGGQTSDVARRRAGNRGEYEAYCVLVRLLHGEKKFLFGTIIPEKDEHFQEVDLLCFWRNILYVVEVKNIGKPGQPIQAFVNRNQWPLPYRTPDFSSQYYYSPVVQNHQHALAVQSYLRKHGFTGFKVRSLIYYANDVRFVIPDPACTNPEYFCIPFILASRTSIKERLSHDLKEKAPNRLSDSLTGAYDLLSSLPKIGSRERMRRIKEREYFGNMRIETKKQGYFFSKSHEAIYAYNNFYVEVLGMDILDPFDDSRNVWTYIGDSDEDLLPPDAEAIEGRELLDYYHLLQVRPF